MFSNIIISSFILLITKNTHISSRILDKRNVGFIDHTETSHENLKKVSEDQMTITIKKVKGIYLCDSENMCESITDYDIAKNESFDCKDRNLGIVFRQINPLSLNGSKLITHGYLKKDIPFLTKSQFRSSVCYQIKMLIYC